MEYLSKVVYADGSEGQCLISNLRTETGPLGVTITADVSLHHAFRGVKKLVSGPSQFPVPFGPEYVIRVVEQVVGMAMRCEAVFVRRTAAVGGGAETWVFHQDPEVCLCGDCEATREWFWERGIEADAYDARCDECVNERASRLYLRA